MLEQWYKEQFESSSGKTPQFSAFTRNFKAQIKAQAERANLDVEFNIGHFYISGFFTNRTTGKMAYFNTSDVRGYFGKSWYEDILYRTAKHNKDWTGGMNHTCHINSLIDNVCSLTM